MTDFIKKNKFLVHVVTEICCLSLVVFYMVRSNKNIYNHLQYLEQKLYKYEAILERHEQSLNTLLNKKVSLNEPLKVYASSPPPSRVKNEEEIDQVIEEELLHLLQPDLKL